MLNSTVLENITIPQKWYSPFIKKTRTVLLLLWPIFSIAVLVPSIIQVLKYCHYEKTAFYFGQFAKLGLLGMAVWLHRTKRGKTLPILLMIGFSLRQVLLLIIVLVNKILDYPVFWFDTLSDYGINILVTVLLLFFSVKATQYLWKNCRYQELFAFHKIQWLQTNKIAWLERFMPSLIPKTYGTTKISVPDFLKWPWEARKWLLSFWFAPVIYHFWVTQIFFLPQASLLQFVKYILIMIVPFCIVLVSLFLYRACRLINRFGVVIAAMTNIVAAGYGMIQYGIYYFQNPPITWRNNNATTIFKQFGNFIDNPSAWIFLIDFLFLALGTYLSVKLGFSDLKRERKSKASKVSTNYGSAKFLDLKGIKRLNDNEGLPIGAIPKVSTFEDPQKLVHSIKKHGGDALIRIKSSHTTLVAPSRSGKGTGIIIPTLLEYPGPVFVTDVKGENYPVTKRAREAKNRRVIAFDPFGITGSPRINIDPLKILDPNSMEVVEDAQTLSKLICPDSGHDGTNAHHFRSQAAALIQCLLLYVACSNRVLGPQKNLAYVYDLLCLPLEDQTNLMQAIAADEALAYGTPARIANSIASAHFEERSGIFSTARVEMRFIDTPQVRASVTTPQNTPPSQKIPANDDIENTSPKALSNATVLLSDITRGDMDLFVCIPLEKLATQHRLLRLITGIVFIEMQKARGKIGKHNLLMLLDEMPALGYMKQIEEMLVYGGGFGISLLAVSQTIEFLQSVYPNTWKTFFSNQLSLFFGCSEPMTAEFVAKKLGSKTIEVSSANQGTSAQKRTLELIQTSSVQSGDSFSETGRELLMPSEIEKLGDRVVLAFHRGEDPIICHRIDYRERPEWVGLWDDNPLHANRMSHSQYSIQEYFKMIYQILAS